MSRLTSPAGRPGASVAHASSAAQPSAAQPHGAPPHLARSLSNRHIQLIAIGGAIGTGLFMGSGKTISLAGPSVIFVYMIIGFMLFFVMRAMGELLLSNLEYKSFSDFAGDLLGPWASFFTSWTYWLCWIVTAIAELIAIALYASFWWPDLPLWIPALGAVLVLLAFNLTSVKAFGETEFWFALIKIIAIVTLIVVGLVMVFTNFVSPGGTPASFSNLWNDGGMFPTGPMGFIAGFQLSVFAFLGVELVGTTAAEAQHPEKNLPKAINSIPLRIMLFYVLALIMIMTVTPWREVTADVSPFVAMFALAGLGAAAAVINFVVLTSATSSANSGLYSTSRMLFGLSVEGTAPGRFQRLSQHKVPANALLFSCMFLLVSAVLLYASSSIIEVFTVVTTMASVLFIFVWGIIVVSYIVYRRRRPALHAASKFKMPGGVYMSYVLLAFFVFLIWALTQKADTLEALLVTPVWFIGLGIVWLVLRRRPEHRARQSLHEAAVRIDAAAAAEWEATRA